MNPRSRTTFICAFLAPAVIIYAALVVWPLLQSFHLSTYRWSGLSTKHTYVGTGNFVKLSHDSVFWRSIEHNLALLLIGGVLIVGLSVAIAHGVSGTGRVSATLRAIILVPQMISVVAVAILWMFIFNPRFGLLTSGLRGAGLNSWIHTWLGEPATALPAVGAAFIWYVLGLYVMIFAAGLRALPAEVFEAAELDGASGLKRFWRVSWPMLWSVKRVVIVHMVISVMNVFALVFLMTQGGPDRSTEVMLTYLYESAFRNSQFGYATAIAVASFLVTMALSLSVLFVLRRDPSARRG